MEREQKQRVSPVSTSACICIYLSHATLQQQTAYDSKTLEKSWKRNSVHCCQFEWKRITHCCQKNTESQDNLGFLSNPLKNHSDLFSFLFQSRFIVPTLRLHGEEICSEWKTLTAALCMQDYSSTATSSPTSCIYLCTWGLSQMVPDTEPQFMHRTVLNPFSSSV